MNQLFTDIRSGVRMLVKYRTLSLVAILTLGVGIGLSTTVFCVVNGGLFKGLPFPNADRIVAVVTTNPAQNQPRQAMSEHDLAVWESRQTSFDRIGAYAFAPVNLSSEDGRPERFAGGQLTVAAFEALGVQPMLGRGFQPGDDKAGAAAHHSSQSRSLARPLRQLSRDRWQSDSRKRPAAGSDRRDAAEVRIPHPRGRVDATDG